MIARTVLGTLFIASVLALKLSGAPDVLTFSYTPIYIYTLAIYATTPVLGYIHRRQERWLSLAFTYGLTSVDLALVSWLALYTGGSSSPFLFLYLFIIIGAAMLRQRRGALIMTALSMVLLGSIIVLEFHGKLPQIYLTQVHTATSAELLVAAFYNIFAFYLVGILSSYLAERLRTASEEIDRRDLDISILKGLQDRIIDNVASGLLTLDDQGRILLANRQAEKVLGIPVSRLVRENIARAMPGLRMLDGDADNRQELHYIHPDGHAQSLGYSLSRIRLDARRLGFIVVFQDLTRMKELESRMKRQEKLAAVGSMAAGIAHEIRNPLGSISGSLQLLRKPSEMSEEETGELLSIALREVDRLNALVGDFLSYARPMRNAMEEIAPGELFEEITRTLQNAPATPPNVNFVNQAPPEILLHADKASTRQIFLNLILNAIQAHASRIELRASSTPRDITIEFEDNGDGIPAQAMQRLFEPFFSTKSEGVGLGLAIVYRVMEEYHGSVQVESRPGHTVFKLTFPKESGAA